MLGIPKILLAFVIGVAALQPPIVCENESGKPKDPQPPALTSGATSGPDLASPEYEVEVEQQLLELVNRSRMEAGVPTLTLDLGLSRAARIHAQTMLEARELSHRLDGELPMPRRLAASTHLQLEQEGENVALDFSAQSGHQHLMNSPPHRANLLNPAYTVVGLGVVRSGNRLYIVQDFGRAIPSYSPSEFRDGVFTTVNQLRDRAGRAALERANRPATDDAACSMARSDNLRSRVVFQLAERYTVLTFTSLRPEPLPAEATPAITSLNLQRTSIGVCYARTETYPTGAYWVVLTLE